MYRANSFNGPAFMKYFIRNTAQCKLSSYKTMRKTVAKVAAGEMNEMDFVQFAVVRFMRGFLRDGLAAVGLCSLCDFPMWYVAIYIIVRWAMFAGNILRMFLDELVGK